ncbi:hypothetical protein D3C75_847270 [compost metagenome]
MNNNVFTKEDLKILNLKELHGKTLKIQVAESDDGNTIVIAGRDEETGTIYVLHSETSVDSKIEKRRK